MDAAGNMMYGVDRKTWGRDCEDMNELELIVWKTENETLEELHLHGLWVLPEEFPYYPVELDHPDYAAEKYLHDRYFGTIFEWYWRVLTEVLIPREEEREVERAIFFDSLPFADYQAIEEQGEVADLYDLLPFSGLSIDEIEYEMQY